MKSTVEWLRAVKAQLGIESDYALAKALGVTKQSVSRYRAGGGLDDAVALRVAKILDVEPAAVLAAAHAERAKEPELRKVWQKIAAKVAAGVLVAIGGTLAAPAPAGASTSTASPAVYYGKSRRWWLIPLLPPSPPDDALHA